MSYLVCDKCGSYYELQEGESPDDFDLALNAVLYSSIVIFDGEFIVILGDSDDPKQLAIAFQNASRFIKNQGTEMVNGILEGDPVAFAKGGAGITLGIGIPYH